MANSGGRRSQNGSLTQANRASKPGNKVLQRQERSAGRFQCSRRFGGSKGPYCPMRNSVFDSGGDQ